MPIGILESYDPNYTKHLKYRKNYPKNPLKISLYFANATSRTLAEYPFISPNLGRVNDPHWSKKGVPPTSAAPEYDLKNLCSAI